MRRFLCIKCGEECDLIEADHGGYEEVWGYKTWVPALVNVSDCCESEYEEIKE